MAGNILSVTLPLAACLCALPLAAQASWKPTQPVELIVMAGAGGGADKAARLIAGLVEQHKLAPATFRIVNMPARSGSDALNYLKAKTGDDHVLLVTLNSFFTTPLVQPSSTIDIATFTPIARMGLDPFLLSVHSDRKDIASLEDFVAAARTRGEAWVMAGTGVQSEDELLTHFLNFHYKLKMKYAPSGGGGTVAKQLAGKSVDSTVNNPSEQQAYHKAGTTKPLASFTWERLLRYPDTPTLRERGLEFEYLMERSIAGPPGMSREAQAFYSALFAKVYDLPEWQDYREQESLLGEFMSGDKLLDSWRSQLELHRQLLQVLSRQKG